MIRKARTLSALAAVLAAMAAIPAAASADTCDPATAAVIASAGTVTPIAGCQPSYYLVNLRLGDTLHIRPGPGSGGGDGAVFALPLRNPNPLDNAAPTPQVCRFSFLGASGDGADCLSPRTATFLLSLNSYPDDQTPGASLTLAVTAFANSHAVPGSCDIAHAPTVAPLTRQVDAPLICPGGRMFFRVRVDRDGRRLAFHVAPGPLDPSPPLIGEQEQYSVYGPGTNEFNIARRRRVCGRFVVIAQSVNTCTFPRAGRYLLAFSGYAVDTFVVRKIARRR